MKQNERLLVYAVTGFLAVILVIAVLFGPSGREATAKVGSIDPRSATDGVRDLGQMLGQAGLADGSGPKEEAGAKPGKNAPPVADAAPKSVPGGAAKDPVAAPPSGGTGVADLPPPGQVTPQQPLVAAERSLLAVDLVAQQLGASRRDRSVRLVRARAGDSLETLVRRWCGARDPYLEEARSLNEDLVVLRVGQEVCVPWVDDEVVLAAWEASKPKTLTPATVPAAAPATTPNRPSFAEPGAVRPESGQGQAPSIPSDYTVKDGDSLWKIASRVYGRDNAARMVPELRKANPGAGDTLRVGQKLVLPTP